EVAVIYQQRLDYFAQLSYDEQRNLIEEIGESMERYRDLVDIAIMNEADDIARQKAEEFNSYVKKFSQFAGDAEDLEYDETQQDLEEQADDSIDLTQPLPIE